MSDLKIILSALQKNPNSTTRELVSIIKSYGSSLDKHSINSALYRMIRQGIVEKDNSTVPRWKYIGDEENIVVPIHEVVDSKSSSTIISDNKSKRITEIVYENSFKIQLSDYLVSFAYDIKASSNDPYLIADWLDDHLFISINIQHPFWKAFVVNEEIKKYYLMFAAQDALIQWLAAKRGDAISSSGLNDLRDQILRSISKSTSTDL